MLYSFAITPDAFETTASRGHDQEGVILIELLRGMHDNGLLADLEKGRWLTAIRQIQDGNTEKPDIKDKVESCLVVLADRHRIIRHPRHPDLDDSDDFHWLASALRRHQADAQNPFKAVFATEEYIDLSEINDNIFVALPASLDSEPWRSRRRSSRFTKTQANLQQQLRPLVRYAQGVTLIDPYMSCRKERFFNTVEHCANLLGNHDGRQEAGTIRIHAGDPMSDPDERHRESARDRLDRWRGALEPLASHYKHSFRVQLWRNRPGQKTFHDRYIITDQCGVSAPGGLDFIEGATRANVTTWTMMEADDVANVINREFRSRNGPYLPLGLPLEIRP